MRKFLIRLFVFFLLMVACDVAMGFVGNYLIAHAKGSNTKRKNYIVYGTNEDVLIFGSSRALRHYDPSVFEDTLGVSTYNCGFTANGIICAYGFFRMVEERYLPKVLVYDVLFGMDLLEGDDHTYLGELRYYYDKEGIDSIFWRVDEKERYKMLSQMYRFNSMLPQLITDNLHPLHDLAKGYEPHDWEMNFEPSVDNDDKGYICDSLKLYYLERLIKECNGKTALIFTVSPFYKKTSDVVLEPIRDLCDIYGVPLISHFTDTAFNFKKEYFYDSYHLNRTGATEYSKVIAGEIRQLLEQQTSMNKPSGT